MVGDRQENDEIGNKVVLMISYDLPPMGTPGALRAAKFARYLPKYGWDPIVVTCKIGSSSSSGLEDHQQLKSVRVVRSGDWKELFKKTKTGSSSTPRPASAPNNRRESLLSRAVKKILFPDHVMTWYPNAVKDATSLVRNQRIDAVFSSSPSITNHLVAGKIARRFGLPWVADFRDLWALAWDAASETWTQKRRRRCEQAIVRQADRVVVVTEGLRAAFSEAYPESKSKFVLIRNGFDQSDIGAIEPTPPSDRLILTHSGILYGGDRNTGPLLQAIARLKERSLLTCENFRLDFVGHLEPQLVRQIEALGLSGLIKCVGRVPYRESLQRMAASSAALIIVHSSHIGFSSVPIKFYDALAVQRPILALVKKGYEMANLVETLGVGEVVDPDDTEGIADWIAKELYQLSHDGPRKNLDMDTVSMYSREQRAADLAGVLNEICD